VAKLLQWVNLPKNGTFVDGKDVTSLERAGAVHFEATFAKGYSSPFKVRVVPSGSDNATYSAAEATRNANFGPPRHTRTHSNEGKTKVRVLEDVLLPAAGGNTYKIKAKYRKHVVEGTKTIETRRKLFYELLAMADGIQPEFYTRGGKKGVAAPVGTPGTGPVEATYNELFIVLEKTGSNTFAFRQNINSTDTNQRWGVVRDAAKAWASTKYEPWAFACVFCNQICNQKEELLTTAHSPTYTLPPGALSIGSTEIIYPLPTDYYLWYGLDDDDDKNRVFLAKNGCKFVDSTGTAHDIPDENVTVDLMAGPPYQSLKIKVPWSVKSFFSGTKGEIQIKLRLIKGFSGGYSEPKYNFTIIAKRAWFQITYTDAQQCQIITHETGHKFGMVPYGNKIPAAGDYFGGGAKQLDAPGSLYGEDRPNNSQGHQGPHCGVGATWTAATGKWSGTPGCVMWGATNYEDPPGTWHNTTPSYCAECKKLVRKLDLDGSGLPGLNNSISKC
jgi:hypothetical protein